MDKNFLDYTGLTKYTEKIEELIDSKVEGMVPNSREVNSKALTEDINLTAYDVDAVPTSRTVNGKPLSTDITLTADDIGVTTPDLSDYVPSTRKVNAKALDQDINLTAYDVDAVPITRQINGHQLGFDLTLTASDVNAVPTSRTVNGKSLTEDITLSASDIAGLTNPDLSGYVPTSRTVNGKALTSNITLTAEDIGVETQDLSAYAPKASPVFTGSISLGRKSSTTVGMYSVAAGYNVTASNYYSHAEGNGAIAKGSGSHAEGSEAIASGGWSHAEGYSTEASNFASHASGKYNNTMTKGAGAASLIGDVFVIGNGTESSSLSNALRLAYEGTLYLTKAYNSTGADYAEYFEWLDGNPNNEDRVGHFVTLQGDKITLAQEGDYILGVVSGQPCIIGNADEDWLGRWEHDDFNRFVKEYLTHTEVEVTPPDNVLNAENQDEALTLWLLNNEVTERDGHYFKMETEVVDYPTTSWRHKANPNYDPSQSYVERKDRQEWDAVGMVGVLSVLDDGTCLPNSYCKVTANGFATAAGRHEANTDTWRVIERVTPNIIKIIFSIK